MGQIFGNINDPRARESGRGGLSSTHAPAPTADPIESLVQDNTALQEGHSALSPAVAGIGELLRARKENLELRLEEVNRLVTLSEKRAFDLTLEELTEIWESL